MSTSAAHSRLKPLARSRAASRPSEAGSHETSARWLARLATRAVTPAEPRPALGGSATTTAAFEARHLATSIRRTEAAGRLTLASAAADAEHSKSVTGRFAPTVAAKRPTPP